MTARPIIMSTHSIPLIMAGTKTQTRRVMKVQPFWESEPFTGPGPFFDDRGVWFKPPYKPGDLLWVRETWKYDDWTEDGDPWIAYKADGERRMISWLPDEWQDRVAEIFTDLSDDYGREGRACD